jgi:hypothetical protein
VLQQLLLHHAYIGTSCLCLVHLHYGWKQLTSASTAILRVKTAPAVPELTAVEEGWEGMAEMQVMLCMQWSSAGFRA